MRTAESFLNERYYKRGDPEIDFESLELIINEARIEAIKECAKKMYDYYDPTWGFDQVQFENDFIEQVK